MYLSGDFIPQGLTPFCENIETNEIVLANLEGPVCSAALPKAAKTGIHLRSNPFELNGRWAFALANNHLMDYGEAGLKETTAFLQAKGFLFAGAGCNLAEARRPMTLEENGKRIAVFSCCERQYGSADADSCGTAEKGLWLFEAIKKIKADGKADYVIVSSHAASEFSPFISPKLQEFYRALIDCGADIIHGHHSHVPQGYERYGHGFIFYGLGNYLVNARQWRKVNQNWSRVVRLIFDEDGLHVIPPRVYVCESDAKSTKSRLGVGPEILPCENYCDIVDRQCTDPHLTRALWQEASVQLYHRIYEQLLRAPSTENVKIPFRVAVRKALFAVKDLWSAVTRREIPTDKTRFYASCIGSYCWCESHREMIATALGVLTGSEVDLRTKETSCLAKECGL